MSQEARDHTGARALRAFGRESISKGSKSFAIASYFFREEMQANSQMLYAWCRYCDDVIDGQTLGGDAPDGDLSSEERRRLVDMLRAKTIQAMDGHPTGEPAFDGFAAVARAAHLPRHYPLDLIDGFALDVEPRIYASAQELLTYCYGVAGVVGVMMAIVMGVPRDDDATLARACDMGLAFQMTNIARDVMDDARGGRVYLPADYLMQEGVEPTPQSVLLPEHRAAVRRAAICLLDDADKYYLSATEGVRRLPTRAAAAIAAARNIYRDIGRIVRNGDDDLWTERVVVSRPRKIMLAASGAITGGSASLFKSGQEMAVREGLWDRPMRRV